MAAVQGGVRFDKIAEKWHALAQRRLAYLGELYRSGRWKWYYAEEEFKLLLRDAERATLLWAELAGQRSANAQKRYRSRRLRLSYAFTAAAAACLTVASQVATAQSLKRGEELLTRSCASCHAVGRTGESPNKVAPPFRTLGRRYPIESLEEALGEGILSGHPDMPEFTFDAAMSVPSSPI